MRGIAQFCVCDNSARWPLKVGRLTIRDDAMREAVADWEVPESARGPTAREIDLA